MFSLKSHGAIMGYKLLWLSSKYCTLIKTVTNYLSSHMNVPGNYTVYAGIFVVIKFHAIEIVM